MIDRTEAPSQSKGGDPRRDIYPEDLAAANILALPQVARASGLGDGLGLAAGIVGVLTLGVITWFSLSPQKEHAPHVLQREVIAAPVARSTLPPIDPSVQPGPDAAAPPFFQPLAPSAPASLSTPASDPAAVRAPTLIVDNSVVTPDAPTKGTGDVAGSPAKTGLNANDQFLASQNSDVSQKASRIGDPSKVVPQGAVIPAILETAINSDLPGYTRAIVSRDIRSFDGTAVLIPRGSRLVGQYKSGLASGETRAFIIWNRLIRPDGVSVQLASPATDDLGQAGMSGKVDTHFVKRFGSAILLSIVNGLAGSLNKQSSSNTIVIGTASDAQGVVGEALSSDVKISPTIKVMQGAPIQVFAARDLDFNIGQ